MGLGTGRDLRVGCRVSSLLTPPPRGRPSNLAHGLGCSRKEDWSGLLIGRWVCRKAWKELRGLQEMNPSPLWMTRGRRVLGKKSNGKLFWVSRSLSGTAPEKRRRKLV